ncbi:MAG: non-ribosomal peptide synthetase, partial [Jatrophihabitantaceae bacterium]
MTERADYVLDQRLEPAGPDLLGERYISESGLVGGYFASAEVAADRLVADPFGAPGRRMYRTGELVRPAADGALVRAAVRPLSAAQSAEIAQIEFTLSGLPQGAQLTAVPAEPAAGYLVTISCPVQLTAELDLAGLSERARSLLPERLVPAAIVVSTEQ